MCLSELVDLTDCL